MKLDFRDIVGFNVDGDYAVCLDQNGNKYFIEKSLTRLYKELPETLFYRANRQYIIHRDIVTGFRRGTNGKIIALIKASSLPPEIHISRTKAAAFKKWLQLKQANISSGNL